MCLGIYIDSGCDMFVNVVNITYFFMYKKRNAFGDLITKQERMSTVTNKAPLFQRVRVYRGIDRYNIVGKYTVYAFIVHTMASIALVALAWVIVTLITI